MVEYVKTGFGKYPKPVSFQILKFRNNIFIENPFLFQSDTNFYGGNKTATPSRKRFFEQSPHLRSAFSHASLRVVFSEKVLPNLFSAIRGVFTD